MYKNVFTHWNAELVTVLSTAKLEGLQLCKPNSKKSFIFSLNYNPTAFTRKILQNVDIFFFPIENLKNVH